MSEILDNSGMRWKLDDLFAFRAIVDCGSLTLAASKLAMPKSTVSHVLQRLEADIGLRLIERTARVVRVTPEGQSLYHFASRILEQAEEADAHLTGLQSKPSGRVRLAVPGAFCREFLAPRLVDFVRDFPDVSLDVTVVSNAVDVLGGEFDMAVVVGEQQDSGLSQRRLLSGGLIWISSPAYAELHKLGDNVLDPGPHLKVCEARYAEEHIQVLSEGRSTRFPIPVSTSRINDPLSVRAAVIAGLGVSFLPLRYCREQLSSGHLVQVWQGAPIDAEASKLSVVFPGRRLLAPRCRVVLQFLDQICGVHPQR